MNTITANKIKFIAETAHEDCALTTLKNAKEQITNRSKIHAGYENQWAGIDRAEVLEAFAQAMDCRTKADFSRRLELLIETIINIVIENERPAQTLEAFTAEVVRIANRDFGLWVTRGQVEAVLADGNKYSAQEVARIISNEAKAAERQEQNGAALTAAQAEYNAAADASEAALMDAVEADPEGTQDTAEFRAYEAAEVVLMEKTTALLQTCGRYAVELARRLGKPVSDIEALKTMYAPYYSGNTESVRPGTRNHLVSMALKIDVSATQAA
jgi:hypothetical protein